jgi:Fe-S oxidoreductase
MAIREMISGAKWMVKLVMGLDKESRKIVISNYSNKKELYKPQILDFDADLKKMANCSLCPDMCGFDAPCLRLSKHTSVSPQNKSRIGYFMGTGRIGMDDPSAISTLYSCMTCDACLHWCPLDISAGDLMVQMRAELEKRDLIPESVHHLRTRIESNGSILEQSPFTAGSEFNINMPQSKIFYYIGCMSAENQPSMVRANIAILNYLGIPFSTRFDSRKCCGSPINKVGYKSVAQGLAHQNSQLIRDSGAKIVLTDCPACMSSLKNTYADWGIKIKPTIMHFKDFILEKIESGKLTPKVAQVKNITYHDPCIFARGEKETQTTRKIFAKLPGITLKEAYLHGEETQCCGYGGGYHVTNTDLSNEQGIKRLTELRNQSPDYIVSTCPTCEYAFQQAQIHAVNTKSSAGKHEEVCDLSELVARSLGLEF